MILFWYSAFLMDRVTNASRYDDACMRFWLEDGWGGGMYYYFFHLWFEAKELHQSWNEVIILTLLQIQKCLQNETQLFP